MAHDDGSLLGRAPWLSPAQFDEDQLAFYDELISGPRGREILDEQGRLTGAMNTRLLDPKVGAAIQKLGAVLRFEKKISERWFEILLLEIFRHERNNVEWGSHARKAAATGLSAEAIDAIRLGRRSPDFTADEHVLRDVAREVLTDRDLSDETFETASTAFGLAILFDIISIIGYWQHTSLALKIWRVPLHQGTETVFP
jgi:4-carboxymuconolactone decarboxylase